MSSDNSEYVYLLQEREFIRLNEPTYKIGRSAQPLFRRLDQYPKGSRVLIAIQVSNSLAVENKMKTVFDIKYERKAEYGREYYNGDWKLMMSDIVQIATTHNIQAEGPEPESESESEEEEPEPSYFTFLREIKQRREALRDGKAPENNNADPPLYGLDIDEVPATSLFNKYEEYCRARGYDIWNQTMFGRKIKSKIGKRHATAGSMYNLNQISI